MVGKKTGGRRKGSKNKAAAEKAKAIEASGLTPLDYMLDILRGTHPENADPAQILAWEAMRFEAAKAAAPYVHPKLAALEHKVDASVTVNIKQF